MAPSILILALLGLPHASAWIPTVKSVYEFGNVADPALNRDSCGSVRVDDRMLWTCRDTQGFGGDGKPSLPIWSSSAAWTNFNNLALPDTRMYATSSDRQPYFAQLASECPANSAGGCPDGTRYAIWPDQPPAITARDGSVWTGYTWIARQHIRGDFSSVVKDPEVSLYRFVYDVKSADRNAVPRMTLVREAIFPQGSFPFGTHGSAVKDGLVFLWGKASNGRIAMARVPVGAVEDPRRYEYYVSGRWTATRPGPNDAGVEVANSSAGGQGTYFYSPYWRKWVWIGQAGVSVAAEFYMTTADIPEGPWDKPRSFYRGKDGSAPLAAYTLQAHPGMHLAGYHDGNDVFISYTKNDDVYTTPLVRVFFN
ncbi:hypothetical protein ISF_08282 [Cordyceps fumosorosea ARSEF 2679]|uniref:DUF4185 domain-containing protein n=1 Tax=Cordyceps fumosorosea (strain ARSEF 2679) TaxID=1081104 RepID=A0A167MRQ7_CORFA|nr:hypothetical protein ISF_08282 [Cordyceps fumosorosea ARSEF 2679]OAA54681.1 hypothetical protein ISF_08282 [Cordyceps fumosorosea ARSEF 2679]